MLTAWFFLSFHRQPASRCFCREFEVVEMVRKLLLCSMLCALVCGAVGKEQGRMASLIEFLETPEVNGKVLELASVAWSKYSDPRHPLSQARAEAKQHGEMMGGRSSDWIKETFDQDEAAILDALSKEPAPRTWTVEEIADCYQSVLRTHPPRDRDPPIVTSVKGVGVNYLYDDPALIEGGFAQLASQYNYLESVGPFKTPVSGYLSDWTQGPQGCLEAAAASLHRAAAEEAGLLPHALVDVVPEQHGHYLKHGYLELAKLGQDEKQALHSYLKARLGKLRILAQPVVAEVSKTRFFQVLASAPSWQGYARPEEGSVEAEIAELLIVAQYRAVAQLAVIRAATTGQRVPVHLTLVGQGAYNNPRSVMKEAIREVARTVTGYPLVEVYVQSYSGHEPVRAVHCDQLFRLRELDRDSFEALTL